MLFATLVISKMTTLGDTSRWMSGTIKLPELSMILTNSSMMMDFLGGVSSSVLGTLLGNVPFLTLSFYGIYYSISKLELTNKQLLFILFLLSFPSFGIWSSIAGKEAIGVFFMGIILGYIIDLINRERYRMKIIEIFSIYLLFIFKPQYSVAIFSLIVYVAVSNKFHLKSVGKSALLLFHIALGLSMLWIFKDILNDLSFEMPAHFSLNSGSTRENTIWVENYDFFYNAPYGMFIGFWGPTLSEALLKPMQSMVFVESGVIVGFFIYVLMCNFMRALKTNKLNIYVISLLFIMLFWMLFVHYPFAVLNPGSAIRYRENFYGFIIVFIFFLHLKIKYKPEKGGLK